MHAAITRGGEGLPTVSTGRAWYAVVVLLVGEAAGSHGVRKGAHAAHSVSRQRSERQASCMP